MIIQPFFALLLALPVTTGADAGLSLDQLAACELVVMAQVTAELPDVAYLTVRSKAGLARETAFGIYQLREVVPIKGACPTEIAVVAASSKDGTGWPAGGQSNLRRSLVLPVSERVLLFLQRSKDGRFRMSNYLPAGNDATFDAPADVGFAIYDFTRPGRTLSVSPQAWSATLIKRDYPGRDLARVLAVAKELPPSDVGEADLLGPRRLWLSPPAADLDRRVRDNDQHARRMAELLGPNPFEFFRVEILPKLHPADQDRPLQELLERLVVSGLWGDPGAADQIAQAILAQESFVAADVVPCLTDAVATMGHNMTAAPEASVRLLASRFAPIRRNALYNLASYSCRAYRDQVLRHLDDNDPMVVRAAMVALATMDSDFEHRPMGDPASATLSPEETTLLSYWRQKR